MEAAFIQGTAGRLFTVVHPPAQGAARGCVLFVPPFAEEMNKSRRMVNLQARRLAAAGYAAMIPDPFGTGDSEGDFGEATWDIWLDDLDRCLDVLRQRWNAPLVLWGLRTGCLLISDFLQRHESLRPQATLLWQPVTQGERFLVQFLRLRMASGMMGGTKETTGALKARLDAGEDLEIAGYRLSPSLARSLGEAQLSPPKSGAIIWLEVLPGGMDELPAISQKCLTEWTGQGAVVVTGTVPGDPFWTTHDICEVPALLDRTQRYLDEVA
ncbi:hydrolase 2, exosortase A system-associated [Ectothiorhodospira sp. BSL-9]|uniref:hydrolase 2, exosortase A system-associated n=1 Tax=Ectothiorhodospira sp. BSL-9 TaxID=1442136 RepID=UPI0007B45507|nr:hydrolase 2, exosortase A system-associated [Ectothiorhodospira sp. BSL-9]ANB02206.1 exosortase [Ectothiorhodospira sp. BSL-9]